MPGPFDRTDPLNRLKIVEDQLKKLRQFVYVDLETVPPFAIIGNGNGYDGGGIGADLGGGALFPRYFGDFDQQSGDFQRAGLRSSDVGDYYIGIRLPDGPGAWVVETSFWVQIRLVASGHEDFTVAPAMDPYWLEVTATDSGSISTFAQWYGDAERMLLPFVNATPGSPGLFHWRGHYTQMYYATGTAFDEPNIVSWALKDLKVYAQDWTPLTVTYVVGGWESFAGAPLGNYSTLVHQV